ncbi:MAG: hypothetical protein RLY31_991 [Bacteroidota bacterium]|jgi:hypothetical protein
MQPLDKTYLEKLSRISAAVQESEELSLYLSEEEEEHYEQLRETFEPEIDNLYEKVAAENPLQLAAFDKVLLDEAFEGLFLPRILGYSVLRGAYQSDYKYTLPQDHFKDILLAICHSPNFEILKKRIGQSIQIGFALSSDIWITNLIASVDNKRIRSFLQSQKLDKYRVPEGRAKGYETFRKQFRHFNYMTAEFPTTLGDLKIKTASLREFLIYRIERELDNTSILPFLSETIEIDTFRDQEELTELVFLYANFIRATPDHFARLSARLNAIRQESLRFVERWFDLLESYHNSDRVSLDRSADMQVSSALDKTMPDTLSEYYLLTDIIHQNGYVQEETLEKVKEFYNKQAGLSVVNECLRLTIYKYFRQLLTNLEETDYQELFELAKIFTVYIKIFANEQFNQRLKSLSMQYVHRLMAYFTDKRGKDYQDIKKFVSTTFVDLNFLKEKEVVELFKTRRVKK